MVEEARPGLASIWYLAIAALTVSAWVSFL